jgi:two-component system, OmpR family, response regulator
LATPVAEAAKAERRRFGLPGCPQDDQDHGGARDQDRQYNMRLHGLVCRVRSACLRAPSFSGVCRVCFLRGGIAARKARGPARAQIRLIAGNKQKKKPIMRPDFRLSQPVSQSHDVNKAPHILLVEDDKEIRTLVSRFLTANDLRVATAEDGRQADRLLKDGRFDMVLLDVMLPGEDGFSICRRLRATSGVPVIMLTAKGEEIDRIVGLELGADDYVAKPFNPRELLARVRAVLRRSTERAVGAVRPQGEFMFNGWRLNPSLRQVYNPDGARVALTGAEFQLLLVFCERSGRVLSRDQLIDLTQGRAAAPFERSIDILVSRLRQKLETNPKDPVLIQTVRSGGYIFSPEVKSA